MMRESKILMVPPDGFKFNQETAASNTFQNKIDIHEVDRLAADEFSRMVKQLQPYVDVLILKQNPALPDAVFPNNWFSTHLDDSGKRLLVIYPMLAKNRQAEVNIEGLSQVLNVAGIVVDEVIDLRNLDHQILEGTGSIVLDRLNGYLYASLSPRTNRSLVNQLADRLNYTAIVFHSVDEHNHPIYHTNVMMSIAKHYVVVCMDCITDMSEKQALIEACENTQKHIISISMEQMHHMCGNVFELFDKQQQSILVLSSQAKKYFTPLQLELIQRYSKLLEVDINTIESIGGGSARCMMAEII